MISHHRQRTRTLGFEALSTRQLLSVNPLGESGVLQNEIEVNDVSLRIDEATVERDGNVVTVNGDYLGNDKIDLAMGVDEHVLTLNGDVFRYDANEVNRFVVKPNSYIPQTILQIGLPSSRLIHGNDQINVFCSQLDDRITGSGRELAINSSTYSVSVEQAKVTRVFGAGGHDTVRFNDTPNDDQLYMHNNFSTFVNSDGAAFKVSGVERVEAFAVRGGHDRVRFYDSPGSDRFVAKEEFSYVIGDGFWNFAKGFERVDAHRKSETPPARDADEARLYGSNGNDVLHARPGEVVFTVGDTVMAVHDFATVRAYAGTGIDSAEFHGQDLTTDVFVWETESAFMHTTGDQDPLAFRALRIEPPIEATNFAIGFDSVEATGNDGSDRAELRGGEDNDFLIATPRVVDLYTQSAHAKATDFAITRAFGNGRSDRAYLVDSTGNDRFISNEDYAYLEGRHEHGRYLNYVSGFVVDAVSSNGGFDTAKVSGYAGPKEDYLVLDGSQFLVWGPNRNERIAGFSNVEADGEGAGVYINSPMKSTFSIRGSHSLSDVPSDADVVEIASRLEEEAMIIPFAFVDLVPNT